MVVTHRRAPPARPSACFARCGARTDRRRDRNGAPLRAAPCPKLPGAEELAKASCGYLVVSENCNRPNGRTIKLMVAKYPPRSPEKQPDPDVYLAGGPATLPHWTVKDVKVVLDGGAPVDWLRNQNYAVPTLQAAPDRIDGLAAGRPEALESIALDRVSRAPPPGPDVPAEGSRRSGRHAPAGREQSPDAPHLRQLRYADVACRCEGRRGEAFQRNDHQHPRHRACRLALLALRPGRDCIVPRRPPLALDTSCVGGLEPLPFTLVASP